MLSRKPLSYMQKTYDDCYLVCSTAVYFESQNNEAEALRSWKNALEQINYHNAFRVPVGYKPKGETEKALMESLKQMEEQCKERVSLFEALKKSREEAAEQEKENSGRTPAVVDKVEGWLGGGTIPPTRYEDLSRPPPLPTRPSAPLRHPSANGEDISRAKSAPMEDPVLPSLTPFASNPKQVKQSRTPSPEKRSMLRTLRPGGEKRRESGTAKSPLPPKNKAHIPAAKAAAQAWTPLPNRSGSAINSYYSSSQAAASATRLSPTTTANTSLPRERLKKSEATVLPYRKEYTSPRETRVDTNEAIETARRRHATRRSLDDEVPSSPLGESDSTPPRRSQDKTGSGRKPRRKPVPKTEDEPVYVSADSSSPTAKGKEKAPGEESPEAENLDTPEERLWKEKVSHLMKHLPKGVDSAAAKQIFNEIVVQGDEVHWNDVAGLDVAKNALKETVVYPFLRPDLFMGLREPARGMLLFGPPGTGKTMLARAVATESKSTFFAISASSLTSKFLGESEKLVRALFALAKALAPSIIFVDEIDSLLSSRGDSGEHEATRRIKTEFLIQWSDLARAAAGREQNDKDKERGDASRVLVLAATNLPWAIDEAARRRFVRRQYIPLPEPHVRKLQIETLLGHQKHSLSMREIDRLVRLTEGFSGSDITALAKDAAMGPLRSLGEALLSMSMDEIRPISMDDFANSLKSIRPSVSRDGLKQFEDWAREFGERGG